MSTKEDYNFIELCTTDSVHSTDEIILPLNHDEVIPFNYIFKEIDMHYNSILEFGCYSDKFGYYYRYHNRKVQMIIIEEGKNKVLQSIINTNIDNTQALIFLTYYGWGKVEFKLKYSYGNYTYLSHILKQYDVLGGDTDLVPKIKLYGNGHESNVQVYINPEQVKHITCNRTE